jgi:hypothetical protein
LSAAHKKMLEASMALDLQKLAPFSSPEREAAKGFF